MHVAFEQALAEGAHPLLGHTPVGVVEAHRVELPALLEVAQVVEHPIGGHALPAQPADLRRTAEGAGLRAAEAGEVADAPEGLPVPPGRRRLALAVEGRGGRCQLGVPVGRDVDQVPGAVDQSIPARDSPPLGEGRLAIAQERQPGHSVERLAALDRVHDVEERELALAEGHRVVEPGAQLQLGHHRGEPAPDDRLQLGVSGPDPARAAVRVRHLVAQDARGPVQQRPLAGFDHAAVRLFLRVEVAVDDDHFVALAVRKAGDRQDRERQQVLAGRGPGARVVVLRDQ